MRKERNTFFSEAQMSSNSGFIPNQMYNNPNMMMNGPVPFQNSAQTSQSFYAGAAPVPNNFGTDVETRLSKIERQLNRIETRLSKLESSTLYSSDAIDVNATNMYMV